MKNRLGSTFAARCFALGLATGTVCFASLTHADMVSDGEEAFKETCSVCHSMLPGKVKVGPPLFGVAGRPAASVAGYPYSDAMKASGVIWTPAVLETYLAGPQKMIPGINMTFPGEPDAQLRLALVEYLKTLK